MSKKKHWFMNNLFLSVLKKTELIVGIICFISFIINLFLLIFFIYDKIYNPHFAIPGLFWIISLIFFLFFLILFVLFSAFEEKWLKEPSWREILFKLDKEGQIIEYSSNNFLDQPSSPSYPYMSLWNEPGATFFSLEKKSTNIDWQIYDRVFCHREDRFSLYIQTSFCFYLKEDLKKHDWQEIIDKVKETKGAGLNNLFLKGVDEVVKKSNDKILEEMKRMIQKSITEEELKLRVLEILQDKAREYFNFQFLKESHLLVEKPKYKFTI